MLVTALNTRGSKVAAGAVALLLILGVPIVNGEVEGPATQSALVLAVAVLIGAALGWIAGDTLVHSRAAGRLGVIVVVLLGVFLPVFMRIRSWDDLRLYETFVQSFPEGGATVAIRYATVVFVFMTIVAFIVLFFSPRVASLESSGRADKTGWTALGGFATALGLLLGLITFWDSQHRWRQEVTIRAIADENVDRPYASRHCLGALSKLDDQQLQNAYERLGLRLNKEQAELVRQCFADHEEGEGKDQQKLFKKAEGDSADLTPKGAALLAQRVNYTLTKAGSVASLLKYRIGDRELVSSELRARLCFSVEPVVKRLSETRLGGEKVLVFGKEDPLYWLVKESGFCPQRPATTASIPRRASRIAEESPATSDNK